MKHIRLHLKQNITSISFKEEWQNMPLVIHPKGLGKVRDLFGVLPAMKNLNVKFFLDGAKRESYEAVQILSSLGIYSGIVINENADWERLTDLMYYALCGKAPHAPIEPFQYVYDVYNRNRLVDYGIVYFDEPLVAWQRFFYEPTPCAACAGWRICLGKYAALKDKSGCSAFSTELLNLIDSIKYKPPRPSGTNHPVSLRLPPLQYIGGEYSSSNH